MDLLLLHSASIALKNYQELLKFTHPTSPFALNQAKNLVVKLNDAFAGTNLPLKFRLHSNSLSIVFMLKF